MTAQERARAVVAALQAAPLNHDQDYGDWLAARLTEAIEAAETAARQGPAPANLAETVRNWYREMALAYHPDRGGSNAQQQAINHAHDRLKQLAGIP